MKPVPNPNPGGRFSPPVGPSPKKTIAPGAMKDAARSSDPTHRFHTPGKMGDARPSVSRSGALQRRRARRHQA